MRALRVGESNPERTAELAGLPEAAVAVECDHTRHDTGRQTCRPGCTLCRQYGPPVPHEVAMTILEDMFMLHLRSKRWSCQRWNAYGLACPHGFTDRNCPPEVVLCVS